MGESRSGPCPGRLRRRQSQSSPARSFSPRHNGPFAPSRWAYDNAHDLDPGSVSPPSCPTGRSSLPARGRWATSFASRNLAGVSGRVSSRSICRGQMAFGGTAVAQKVVCLPCANVVRALAVTAGGTFSVLWSTGSGANGPPVLGGGAVVSLNTCTGALFALSQSSGRQLAQIQIGGVPHFPSPTLVGADAYIGTNYGVVMVRRASEFRRRPPPAGHGSGGEDPRRRPAHGPSAWRGPGARGRSSPPPAGRRGPAPQWTRRARHPGWRTTARARPSPRTRR